MFFEVDAVLVVDQTFHSLPEWLKWASENPRVYSSDSADEIARRIVANGLVEPYTGRSVSGSHVVATEGNWREGLVANGINSRMRAVLLLIAEKIGLKPSADVRIFATEAITPFALVMRSAFPRFLGSEYGADDAARRALFPIPHEDLTSLTLPSESFDIVTTNEVLEHVPGLDTALNEIARVLKPGGWHVGTHPFRFMNDEGDVRTILSDSKTVHLKEPEYHGNPTDPARGSLVFETPGWNILPRAKAAGFRDAHMRFVASEKHGILTENTGVFVLCAQK